MTAFWRFSEDFRPLSQDFRRFSKTCAKVTRTKIPEAISKDYQILPKTFEEDPKMFRSYTNEFKYNWRVKLDISVIINIFTAEDMEIRHSSPGCGFVWI